MKNTHKTDKPDSLSDCVRRAGRVSAERRRLAFALAQQVGLFLAQDAPSRDALTAAYNALLASGWTPKGLK